MTAIRVSPLSFMSPSNGQRPALALYKDASPRLVERQWIVRRWNRVKSAPALGKPWRFHTQDDAEAWIQEKFPALNMYVPEPGTEPGPLSLWM